jgi:GntR family transcriptional regulator/MocR family aminotransferase
MSKGAGGALLDMLAVRRAPGRPIYRQIFGGIRERILRGELAVGARLPSTRTLARELGVSRHTVMQAFEQLQAEGLISSHIGDGAYVLDGAAGHGFAVARDAAAPRPAGRRIALSNRGARLAGAGLERRPHLAQRAFYPGLPALDLFPKATWRRLSNRHLATASTALYGYGDIAGLPALRQAIAAYLRVARGMSIGADDVVVVASTWQAMDILLRLVADPGDKVWLENPGPEQVAAVVRAAGLTAVPVPTDADGLVVAEGETRAADARLAVVNPSHQFSTGGVMREPRRRALLAWARQFGALVVENDYECEFRYDERPETPLHALDGGDSVLYLATFSNILGPGMRLAYVVVPPGLREAFLAAKSAISGHTALFQQAVLADFIGEGYLVSHIRKLRDAYAERRRALSQALVAQLGSRTTLHASGRGTSLILELNQDSATLIAAAAAREGVAVKPLASYYQASSDLNALVLGYAAVTEAEVPRAVARLKAAFERG